MHETRLKFCSAGEALVWQSFILGRERGRGGLLRACSPCLLPALPTAALAKGWTRGLGVEAMHAACPCDAGKWAWKAAVPTSKEIWGQGCNPAFPEDRFPMIFFFAKWFSLNRSLPPQQGAADGGFPAIPRATVPPIHPSSDGWGLINPRAAHPVRTPARK